MKTYFTCLLFAIVFISVHSQDGIDFKNKSLDKEILKVYHIESYDLEVIDSFRSGIYNNGRYFKIISGTDNLGYTYIGRVNACRAGGCSAENEVVEDGFEYFDYFILYNSHLSIQTVKIFNYQATYGHEITAKSWLKQFEGYDGVESLEVGKDIDAISGATVSGYSLTYDIVSVHNTLKKLKL